MLLDQLDQNLGIISAAATSVTDLEYLGAPVPLGDRLWSIHGHWWPFALPLFQLCEDWVAPGLFYAQPISFSFVATSSLGP